MHSDTPLTVASPSPAEHRRRIGSALRGVDRHWSTNPADLRPGPARERVLATLIARTAAAVGADAGGHMRRVGEIARALAKHAGWTDQDAEDLAVYGALHDVGKSGVRASILNKRGPLTAAEEEEVRRHPRLGHDLLSRSRTPLLRAAAVVALQHHERWDGRGYPDGVRAEQIDVRARMIALADVYDALTSPRPYRPPLSSVAARDLMRGMRGSHFDPTLFDLFDSAWDRFGASCG
jgi:HD-GYP domain-containing protein (c-di-GMP phosphodiesterase class II)